MNRFAGALVVGALAPVALVAFAEAACNAIPNIDRLRVDTSVPIPEFGYKGALGRIDRVHLLPAKMAPTDPGARAMIVAPDGICVGPDGRPIAAARPRLARVEDLAVLVYFRSVDGKRVMVRGYAEEETCHALTGGAPAGRPAEGMRLDVMRTCDNGGVKPIAIGESVDGLRIPLPDASTLERELGPGGALAEVRVVVVPKGRAVALLESAASQSCSQMCPRLVEENAVACIDDLFALSAGPGGQAKYSVDPVPCHVQMPATLLPNDFSKACENEDTTAPSCQPGTPLPDLKLWQDRCGGVHVPFVWTNIRLPPGERRAVRGRTGIGRKKSDENPRVWVPAREFMGSTPVQDPQGTQPGVSWRKPLVFPWIRTDAPEEFGLQGTVDEENSIVHVFPRLRTQLVCAGTAGANACMGVEQDTTGGFVTCACGDRELPGCTCDELTTARYFVCGSGVSRGMPCTRDRHCDPDGRCDGKPHCQEPGDVWTGQLDDTGKECTVEEDCATEGTKTQCGYRLFNLENAIEYAGAPPPPKTGIVVLEAKIVGGGTRKRRGACRTDGAACGNGSGPAACPQGDCRGYQLKAGPKQP